MEFEKGRAGVLSKNSTDYIFQVFVPYREPGYPTTEKVTGRYSGDKNR